MTGRLAKNISEVPQRLKEMFFVMLHGYETAYDVQCLQRIYE